MIRLYLENKLKRGGKHTTGVLTCGPRMAAMTNPITLNLLLEHEYCNGTYNFFCLPFPQKTSHYNINHELLSKFHSLSLLLPYFYYQQNKYLCSRLYCHKYSIVLSVILPLVIILMVPLISFLHNFFYTPPFKSKK